LYVRLDASFAKQKRGTGFQPVPHRQDADATKKSEKSQTSLLPEDCLAM
jgi:hypothetical protein